MNTSFLSLLRCQFCTGKLIASGANKSTGELKYGTLKCYCGEYPVVNGIPVLKKGVIGTAGQTAEQIAALIKAGQESEALFSLLSPTYPSLLSKAWRPIQRIPGLRRLPRFIHRRPRSLWNQRTLSLLSNPQTYTACEFLQHYFLNRNNLNYQYFAYRFSNGKYLVGLSLAASLIKEQRGFILDLGCGTGTLTWFLKQQAKDSTVLGLDDSFFALCVAQNWSAPDAMFICCAADTSLPFQDGGCSAVFCSDAFQYFHYKATCISELKRLTGQDGMIVILWMRNGLITHPYAGIALPPAGYQALVADMPHRLVADSEILAQYLQKQGPPLGRSMDMRRLEQEPVMALVASHRQELFEDYGSFREWPHAQGYLSLHPFYVTTRRDTLGNVSLRRTFPSPAYERLNAECKSYLPEELNVHENVLTDLERGKRSADVSELIERFVVLGTPERYGRASISGADLTNM